MKRKTHFTRKNLIFLALLFFFLVIQTFVLLCLDVGGMMKKNNQVASFAQLFGLTLLDLNIVNYVTYLLIVFYTFVFFAAVLYQVRLARYYDEKPFSKKYVLQYVATFFICVILSFGLSIFLQLPYSLDKLAFTFKMIWESLFLGILIYIVLGSIIFAVFVLYINFKNIDKPYRFFGKKDIYDEEELVEREIAKEKKDKEESDLSKSLDLPAELSGNINANANGIGGTTTVQGGVSNNEEEPLKDKQIVFPGLCTIDNEFEFGAPHIDSTNITLEELATRFRNYLASNHLYFDIRIIREFISSFATTRLVILEGLSGTGKSSLPRYFASFIGEDAFLTPVQATWRDRTSLLGYYNDFSRTFNETDFLKRLYRASYTTSNINIMVLDELNLSRIEYYFADFLSVLEYPSSEWKINLMQLPYSFDAPSHVIDGKVIIPENTFFVGTANKDDSTYTITDKVYDRAITLSFDDRNEPFEVEGEVGSINISYEDLNRLFDESKNDESKKLTREELETFKKLSNFTYETFDITFGNRILNQINEFVPVFVATGGTKEEALDFLFTRKILYKIEGRFEDYIKQGLLELKKLITKLYQDKFTMSIQEIDKMLKRL
ncbi:MAG: hypothetical protein SOW55_04035 [Bacilli bacterium]|nr:hypothetical protein [Bacilli bacterium]